MLKAISCGRTKINVIPLSYANPYTLIDMISHALEDSTNPVVIMPGISLANLVKRKIGCKINIMNYRDLRDLKVYDRVIVVLPEIHLRSITSPSTDNVDVLKILEELGLCDSSVTLISSVFSEENLLRRGASNREELGLVEYLGEEALTIFNQLYNGLTPSPWQVTALKILAGMLESGGSLITVMPTGSGKSAIFHVASRLASSNGLGLYTLVITPLRALMRDQVYRATRRGLKAEYVDSSVPREERERIYDMVRRGLLDLLYVTPERFWDPMFKDFIENVKPSLIVLDEVHVVISWGSTFRPSYLNVAKTLSSYRARNGFKPPLLGLSATLTIDSAKEILRMLGHDREPVILDLSREGFQHVSLDSKIPVIIKSRPLRDNLVFDVIPAPFGFERLKLLVDVIKAMIESCRSSYDSWVGVVFTGYAESKAIEWANVSTIAKTLSEAFNVKVLAYHGELREASRRRVEELLLKGEVSEVIVVATKAFGMGIDVPNIRWIVFYTPSDSIEDLYQEAGRAGRDGRKALLKIMYNPADIEFKRKLSRVSKLKPSYVLRVSNTIAKMVENLPRDYGHIILPLNTFKYRVYALKALEVIRGMGIIDYHIIRSSRLTLSTSSKGIYMKLSNSSYVTLDKGDTEVEVYVCRDNPLYDPVALKAEGKVVLQTGKCPGLWVKVVDRDALVIEVTGGLRLDHILEPQVFLNIIRSQVVEEENLDKVAELLEKALAIRNREPRFVDEAVKKYILEYFERIHKPIRVPEIPQIIKCKSNCYEEASLKIWDLVKSSGGPEGVTVFYEEPWDPGELAKAYQMVTGEALNVKLKKIGKLLRILAKGGWERLMDEGYIVVLSKPSLKFERLVKTLEGYKYYVMLAFSS